jgi:zinc transporter ZupT
VIIIISFIAGLSTVVGAYAVRFFKNWTKRNTTPIIALAAGIILATAMLELIPEAAELTSSWTLWTLAGFALFFILEQFMVMHACSNSDAPCDHASNHTAILGIGLHSLVDGMLIGLGFEVSSTIGIIATVAVVVHEIPEGIFSYTLLSRGNVGDKRAMLFSWLVAMATPLGATITVLIIKHISAPIVGVLLAITAGNFIYIAATDLIPETHKQSARSSTVLVIVGMAFVYALKQALG